MAERNADHRIAQDKHEIEMEKQLVPGSMEIRKSGQNKVFFISIFGIIAVCFCAYIGETTVASILAGTTLISLVPNFISGIKKRLEKEKLDQNNGN